MPKKKRVFQKAIEDIHARFGRAMKKLSE